MRISDWSSDVCSSDLEGRHGVARSGPAIPEVSGPVVPHDQVLGVRPARPDLYRHPRRAAEDVALDHDALPPRAIIGEGEVDALDAVEEVIAGDRRAIQGPPAADAARNAAQLFVHDACAAGAAEAHPGGTSSAQRWVGENGV